MTPEKDERRVMQYGFYPGHKEPHFEGEYGGFSCIDAACCWALKYDADLLRAAAFREEEKR